MNDCVKRQSWLRARIAERGIDRLLYDVAEVCDDIAEAQDKLLWQDRADALRAFADKVDA